MRTILILAGALALTGCASGPGIAPPPAGFDAAATEFSGWVRVRGEEFQLYASEERLRRGGATPCVSGALPRNAQRAARDLNGMNVRLFGRTRPWSEEAGPLMDLQGSEVENLCRRSVVIEADRVEVIR